MLYLFNVAFEGSSESYAVTPRAANAPAHLRSLGWSMAPKGRLRPAAQPNSGRCSERLFSATASVSVRPIAAVYAGRLRRRIAGLTLFNMVIGRVMDRRRFVGSIAGGLIVFVPLAVRAQSAKIPRIGYVSGTGTAADQGPYVAALRRGLRDLGQIEGRDYAIEYRGAEGKLDAVPIQIDELVRLKVDIIVAPIPPAIRAAKQATKTIPIVIVTGLDPVASGMVDSLARPGGNITGVVTLAQDLDAKRMELLNEVLPRPLRVAVLWAPNDAGGTAHFKQYESAASALKIQLQSLEVQLYDPDVDGAFQSAVNARADAMIIITTAPLFLLQKRIANLAIKNRLPTMFQGSTWVESGGMMSYSTDDFLAFRLAADYVNKILKGAKPADLPVEQLTKFELAVNLSTAKAIGVTFPQGVLLRADKIVQ